MRRLVGQRRVGRRTVGRVLAVAVLLLALAACGSSSPSPTAAPAEPSTTAQTTTDSPANSTAPGATASTAADTTGSTAATEVVSTDPAPPTDRTIRVPQDAATIQAAVDDAKPGDLVLVSAGTYNEAVTVRVPSIVLRGVDRNTVIIDGRNELENGVLVKANNVAVENLTIRRFIVNGLLFTKAYDDNVDDPSQHTVLQGYRASYVTASNNGLYGIYAFFARGGVIEHSYASGHPDSGIYVGQCKPCDVVLRDNLAELNAVGYEGTNASGNLFVLNSVWRRNRIGITPNSQDMERLAPQGDIVVAGNVVEDNQDPEAPSAAQGGSGFGIAVGGGERNVIMRNLVRRNKSAGIVVTDLANYQPEANEVRENTLSDNGIDLALYSSDGSTSVPSRRNCFLGNVFVSSLPEKIESLVACPPESGPGVADIAITSGPLALQPPAPNVDYRTVMLPPDQPSMPDAASTARVPASASVPVVDLASISVPKS